MTGKRYRLIKLKRALETLGLDWEDFWEPAQAVGIRLLLPLPKNAILQGQRSWEKDRCFFPDRPKICISQPLAAMDYFIPNSSCLIGIGKILEVACDDVIQVATRHLGQTTVSIFNINEILPVRIDRFDRTVSIDKFECAVSIFSLGLSDNAPIKLDIEQACLLEEDVERIRSFSTTLYPPGVEDFDAFQPTQHTTRMIRDLNKAYNLFRKKDSIDPCADNTEALITEWIGKTWNSPERLKGKKPISAEILKLSAMIVLGSTRFSIGQFTLEKEVKERHALGTPEALILLDKLAQARFCLKSRLSCIAQCRPASPWL